MTKRCAGDVGQELEKTVAKLNRLLKEAATIPTDLDVRMSITGGWDFCDEDSADRPSPAHTTHQLLFNGVCIYPVRLDIAVWST